MERPRLELIEGERGREERASLRELYRRYGGQVHGRCRHLLGDAARADDAVEEIFARALAHRQEGRSEGRTLAWLLELAADHCLDADGGGEEARARVVALKMQDTSSPRGCFGLLLRRFHARELSGRVADRVRKHVEECQRCGAALAGIDRECEAFRARSFDDFSRTVEARIPGVRAEERSRAGRRPVFKKAIPLAAATALVVALLPGLFEPPAGDDVGRGPAIVWLVAGDGIAREAVEGEPLAPGERIRIRLEPGEPTHLLALSVDGSGVVTLHRELAGRSVPVEHGSARLLPGTIALEGCGPERLYLLLSDRPLAYSEAILAIRRELERAGSVEGMGSLPGLDARQATRLLVKPRTITRG